MKTTIIATLVAFFNIGISSVSAKCYGSSDKVFWQDPGNACWHAERACRGYDGIQGAFQGVYSPGQVKYACVQGTGTQKYEFSVQNRMETPPSTWRMIIASVIFLMRSMVALWEANLLFLGGISGKSFTVHSLRGGNIILTNCVQISADPNRGIC
jgi:hypothetical protein